MSTAEHLEDVIAPGLEHLSWQELFTLAAIGTILNPKPLNSYGAMRFVYDSAYRGGPSFYLEPLVIEDCLRSLVRHGLIEMTSSIDATVTAEAEKLLLSAVRSWE
jgi:hypothetical protein